MRQILDHRPEAVGIFGEREILVPVHRELRRMNEREIPYRPILFTTLDIRSVAKDLDDFYFVSVIAPAENDGPGAALADDGYDDVRGLSYDTTELVLDVIQAVQDESPGLDFDKKTFRDQIVNALGGAVENPLPKTGMTFTSMANSGELHVYRVDDSAIVSMPVRDVGLGEKVDFKAGMMANRFSLWPVFAGLTVFLTVFVTSAHDVYRWYGAGFQKLIRGRRLLSIHFLALVGLQGSVAILLFAFLAETGRIRYDSVLNALVVAMAPSPLLRANFAKIGGTSIGFTDIYDRLLKFLIKKLLLGKYKDPRTNILVVAYYNSRQFLRRTLIEVYQNLPNHDEATRLRADMEAELEKCETVIDKRKALARRLVELRSWEELYNLNCVPESMREDPSNPEKDINDCVRHCLRHSLLESKLQACVDSHLDLESEDVKTHYKTRIDEAHNARDRNFVNVQFLMMRFDYDRDRLIQEGFLEGEQASAHAA